MVLLCVLASLREVILVPAEGRAVKVLGHRRWVAAASASLPMVCPSAIGKTFGLAAATRNLCSLCHDSVAHGRGCARADFAGLCRVDGQTRSARGASGEQVSSKQHRQTSLAAPPTARIFSQTRRDPRRWCSTRPPAGRTGIPGMRQLPGVSGGIIRVRHDF